MEANEIKRDFPQDFQDLPDNDLIGYFFGSRQGDLKNFRISAQKVANSLGIISLGGAPIYFEGNQLPSVNNTDEPVKKGDWVNLTAGQTYLNINGGTNIETPDGRWSIGAFDGNHWVLKDMGELPKTENKINNWVAGDYVLGDQRFHKGQIWEVVVATTNSEPSTNTDWEKNITADYIPVIIDFLGETEPGGILNTGTYSNPVATLERSKFIKVNEGDVFYYSGVVVSGSGSAAVNGYAGANTGSFLVNLLDGKPSGAYIDEPITIPAGVNYVLVSGRSESHPQFTTKVKFESQDFVGSGIGRMQNELIKLQVEVSSNKETLSEIVVNGKNLIDKKLVSYGYWTETGSKASSISTISTPIIPIDATKGTLSINQNPALGVPNKVNFYNDLNAVISTIPTTDDLQGIPIPALAKGFSVNIVSITGGVGDATNNQYVNTLQAEYGDVSTDFEPFGKKLNPSIQSSLKLLPSVEMTIIDVNNFSLLIRHDNGKEAVHTWAKNNKAPQYDTAWRAVDIFVKGVAIAQGQFNWIHIINKPNEGQHVGTGHGCETMLRTKFYIDGKEVVLANNVGKTITGNLFHFDIETVMYAADSAETTANWNGANVVPQLPLIESTKHYMIGGIGRNSKTFCLNKLAILRNDTSFGRCYCAMHHAYRTVFDRHEIVNIENSMVDIQTLAPISPSIVNITGIDSQGRVYDVDGFRGELAREMISYSDRFGYVLKTRARALKEENNLKMNIQIEPSTGKCYFHPVVNTSVASLRSIPIDVFNRGDVLEVYVERELHI